MVAVNAIQGTLIADNAITAVHIATNAVSGTLIADNAVTATHIAQNTITVTQLADDCVESDKIADGVITTNHLNKQMISSQTEVTAVGGDFVLIGDTSDSNNLKKALVSDFGVAGISSSADATAITIDSSEKVGIGETNPAAPLHVEHSSSTAYNGAAEITESLIVSNKNGTDDSGVNNVASIGLHVADGATSQGFINYVRTGNNTGDFTFSQRTASSTYVEAMRIESSGRVNIGHLSSSGNGSAAVLSIGNASGGTINLIDSDDAPTNGGLSQIYGGNQRMYFYTGGSGASSYMQFYTNDSERMRILSDGEIVQGSAIADTYAPLVNGITGDALVVGRHSTSGSLGLWRTNTMEFKYYHNGQGYIMTFGSNGVISGDFNDTSDVNLKENISTIADGTTVINSLRPVKFDWKDAKKGNNQHGFIAQEVEKVLPDAVEGNDYVENETGLPEDEPAGNGKNMNSNAVLAHAVKAIQELEARIKVLEG